MSLYGYGLHNLPIVEYVSVILAQHTIREGTYVTLPCPHLHKSIQQAARCLRKRRRALPDAIYDIRRRDEKPLSALERDGVINALSFGRR